MSGNAFDDLFHQVVPGVPELGGLIGRLSRAGLTVAAAESLTGGLLTAALTSVPGSSAVVRGALVVYATDLKSSLAGVDAGLLAEHGPVHPAVAAALAAGARERCAADLGLGLTGVAGPDPQGDQPVGQWYVALSDGDRTLAAHADTTGIADGEPHEVRHRIRVVACVAALDLLLDYLNQLPAAG